MKKSDIGGRSGRCWRGSMIPNRGVELFDGASDEVVGRRAAFLGQDIERALL
jgi:hypothetical protein